MLSPSHTFYFPNSNEQNNPERPFIYFYDPSELRNLYQEMCLPLDVLISLHFVSISHTTSDFVYQTHCHSPAT